MSKLDDLVKACDRADAAVVREINKRFPVGSPVLVKWGRGTLAAHIAFKASTLSRYTLGVRTTSGNIHHKHFSDLDLA